MKLLHAPLFVLALLAAPASKAEEPAFKAGFAQRDITPAVGMEQPGGYGKAYHTTFHDACLARAAVFDDGHACVALVGIDSLLIRKQSVAKVRERIRERCGIAPDHILISASHTHAGGPIGFLDSGEYDASDPFIRDLVENKSTASNEEYLAGVESAIADAVCEAYTNRVPAKAGVGLGVEEKVSFNRRFRMKSGQSWTHPGQGNPDIIEPAGPIDPGVGVLGAWNNEGKLLGCIVNFACHATTGPGGISADYIHYITRAIRGVFGEEVVVVFLPGAGGDVTQVDNRSPYQIRQFGEVSSRFVGGRVGAEAVKTLLAMEQGTGPLAPLAAKSEVLTIPRRIPRPEKVAKAREIVEAGPDKSDATTWTFAKETVVLASRIAKEPACELEVQAVQVGPAVYLACPAEYFCAFGLRLKAESRFPFTFPVSMANDCVGYVPTEDALGPGGGGYETRLTSYSNLIPTAGTTMANTLLKLAVTLTPGPVPEPAPLPPFTGKPWSYGDVPPEVD